MIPEDQLAGVQAPAIKLGFIETFLGTLVAPVQTFRQLAIESQSDTHQLPCAFAIVVLVFAIDGLRLTPARELSWALVNAPGEVTGGLTIWLLSALIVSLCAVCFGANMGRVRAAFVTMGWSLLPWLFLGPISNFGKILGGVNIIFMALPLVWILFLQIIAIKESLAMRTWQALVFVMVIPPLLSWYQIIQFFQSLTATFGSLLN